MEHKRIVRKEWKNGEVKYVVEVKTTIFGFTVVNWHTDTYSRRGISFWAEFDTFERAKEHCGIDTNPLLHKEVLQEFDF